MPADVSLGYCDTVRMFAAPISAAALRERRRNARHEANWSVSLVFDPRTGLPELQASTHDVSAFGACVISPCPTPLGEVVGLLLRPKLRDRKARPILLTVLARVVSAVRTADQQTYRYGLSFVRPLDEIEQLVLSATDHPLPGQLGQRVDSIGTVAQPQ